MEKIVEKYKLLVGLKITHQNFKQETDAVEDWLIIKPNAETEAIFKQNRMILRQVKDGFLVLIQTKNSAGDEKKPLFSVKDLVLVFELAFANPAIASQTALPLKTAKKYNFSNEKTGLAARNLASAPPVFNNALKYLAGEIVKDGTDYKMAVFDFTKPPDQERIKFQKISVWNNYVTTENLENVSVDNGFGRISIKISDSLGPSFSLLTLTTELISPTFEIRILNILS